MIKQASLFSQILCLVDRHHFEREVRRWEAERHTKGFSCWSQFVAMLVYHEGCLIFYSPTTPSLASPSGMSLNFLEHVGSVLRASEPLKFFSET